MLLYIYSFYALFALSAGYALIRGGSPERAVAVIFLLGRIGTHLASRAYPTRFHSLEVGVAIVDLVMLLALIAVAMRSTRVWPLVMAAAQVAQVLSHLVSLAPVTSLTWIYSVASMIMAYLMLPLLAIGTLRHQLRLDRYGADPAWKASSFPLSSSRPGITRQG